MGKHFHLLVRVRPDGDYSDAEVKRRFHLQYGEDQEFREGQLPFYRQKWSSLSESMRCPELVLRVFPWEKAAAGKGTADEAHHEEHEEQEESIKPDTFRALWRFS